MLAMASFLVMYKLVFGEPDVLKLDKKQKITVAIILVIFCVLIWQIYDMMSSDVAPAPAVKQPQATVAAPAPVVKNTAPPAAAPATAPTPSAPPAATPPVTLPQQSVVGRQTISDRREYLQMSDQLQLAKMQSQLLTQELAVAQAKKQIADLNQQANQMLNASGVASTLGTGENSLRLVYVAKISKKWTATIAQNGTYQTVRIGSFLPDGNLVMGINKKGVTYRDGAQVKLLSFEGIMKVQTTPAVENQNNAENNLVPVSTTAVPPNPKRQQLTRQSIDVLK